jgi:hypothetical protein
MVCSDDFNYIIWHNDRNSVIFIDIMQTKFDFYKRIESDKQIFLTFLKYL